jgi:hypothetical protein
VDYGIFGDTKWKARQGVPERREIAAAAVTNLI